MKKTMKKAIQALRLGNLALVMDESMASRADTALKQEDLLDILEGFVDKVVERPEKKE